MKKFGFTLVEVIVALAVIGVVAALTIPTLVKEHQKKIYASTLSATISDVENALTSMIMRESKDSIDETSFYTGKDDYNNTVTSNGVLTKFLDASYSGGTYTLRNGAQISITKSSNSTTFSDKDALDRGINLTKIIYDIEIDTNGFDIKPNKAGRDRFKFATGEDGKLYPYGGYDYQIYNKNSYTQVKKENCPAAGFDCTGYLVENGYKMDY